MAGRSHQEVTARPIHQRRVELCRLRSAGPVHSSAHCASVRHLHSATDGYGKKLKKSTLGQGV